MNTTFTGEITLPKRARCALLTLGLLATTLAATLGGAVQTVAAPSPAPKAPAATNAASPQLAADFKQLVRIVAGDSDDLLDQAQLFRLIPNILAQGAAGVPFMKQRFGAAQGMEEAFLSGAYIVIHGEQQEWRVLREVLEQDKRKRAWMQQMLGSAEAINRHLDDGETWRPVLALVPAERARKFSLLCAASDDALVRRLGLYCGYWFADPYYWRAVERVAGADKDPLTQRFAASLLKKRSGAK